MTTTKTKLLQLLVYITCSMAVTIINAQIANTTFEDLEEEPSVTTLSSAQMSEMDYKKAMYPPVTYSNAIEDKFYIQEGLPLYFFVSTDENGKNPHKLTNKKQQELTNPMYLDGHGTHYIRHMDYDHGEVEVIFPIHADGISPVSKINFNGTTRYKTSGTTYYGPNLTVSVSATDEMSGIKQVSYAIDGSEYKPYNAEISGLKEGKHEFKAFSVDMVGNFEKDVVSSFVVDHTAPKLDLLTNAPKVVGNETTLGPKSTIAISAEDELSGLKKITYSFDDAVAKKTFYGPIKLWALSDGSHKLDYVATDNVGNTTDPVSFDFYLDNQAPEVNISITGDEYQKSNTTYVSGRSKVTMTATDNKAGVEVIKYSANDAPYKVYDGSFMIDRNMYFSVYAIDKVENKGKGKKNGKLYWFDDKAPSLSMSYNGPKFFTRDTMFIKSNTWIKLKAWDAEAGVAKIKYSKNSGQEVVYDTPFMETKQGYNSYSYSGTDNVNNKSHKSFDFFVDDSAPQIFEHFGVESIGSKKVRDEVLTIYPVQAKLYLAATDNAVGTKRIIYSINGGPQKTYVSPISGFITGKNYTLLVRAEDYLGNKNEKTISFSIEE